MDNVREKLVELLRNGKKEHILFSRIGNPITSIFEPMVDNKMVETLADYLISNGVTVQEQGQWKNIRFITTGDGRVKFGDCSICNSMERVRNFCPNCGAKMLPTPPKGEIK